MKSHAQTQNTQTRFLVENKMLATSDAHIISRREDCDIAIAMTIKPFA